MTKTQRLINRINEKLQPIYDGKVLVNQSAMNDPIVQAVLKEMSLRNFEPMPQPLACLLYTSPSPRDS